MSSTVPSSNTIVNRPVTVSLPKPSEVVPPVITPTTESFPEPATLVHAGKLAIQQDKAIQLDYYVDSVNNKAFMGEDRDSKEKLLVKSKDEFTSSINKIYKTGNDYIFVTENSIYIVSSKIQKRAINATQMREENETDE